MSCFFIKILDKTKKLCYTNYAKQLLYEIFGFLSFYGIIISFLHTNKVEFDKMQIPYLYLYVLKPISFKDCLATTEFAFLCADFGWRIFYLQGKEYGIRTNIGRIKKA